MVPSSRRQFTMNRCMGYFLGEMKENNDNGLEDRVLECYDEFHLLLDKDDGKLRSN